MHGQPLSGDGLLGLWPYRSDEVNDYASSRVKACTESQTRAWVGEEGERGREDRFSPMQRAPDAGVWCKEQV
jgi:hypothetical protein